MALGTFTIAQSFDAGAAAYVSPDYFYRDWTNRYYKYMANGGVIKVSDSPSSTVEKQESNDELQKIISYFYKR